MEPTVTDPIDALYFTVSTVTTVGYGDFIPTTPFTKTFSIFIMLGGIGCALFVMEAFINLIVSSRIREELGLPEKKTRLNNHYIICGHGNVGSQIAIQMMELGEKYIIIEKNRNKVEELVNLGYNVIEGDAQQEETLERAGIDTARGLISSLPETYNAMVALTAKSMRPDIRIVAEVEDHRNADKLIKAGADRVVQVNEMGARAMISQLLYYQADPVCGGSVNPQISSTYEGSDYYFCCHECQSAFLKNPDRFVAPCGASCSKRNNLLIKKSKK